MIILFLTRRRWWKWQRTMTSRFLALLCAGVLIVTSGQSAPFSDRGETLIYPPTTSHQGPSWFEDVAAKAGIDVVNVNGDAISKYYILEATGSGVAIFDYDNDGWPDIFLVNGTYLDGLPAGASATNHLYHNNHDGTFTDVTQKSGLAHSGWGQGVCVGDYDNDGYDDLFVTY